MSTGFVSVPVVPTFKGIEREFATKLVEPAQAAGKRAGESISGGVDDAVKNLERQVKASSTKLEALDRAHEKSRGKQKEQVEKLEAATTSLQAAEEKYKKAVADGKDGLTELARVQAAKARVTKSTNDLRDAEVNVAVAGKKHQDQLDDLNRTLKKHEDAQSKANNEVGKSKGFFGGFRDELSRTRDELNETAEDTVTFGDKLKSGLSKIGTGALLGVGAKIGSTVTEGIGTAFSKGFSRLASIEQAETMLSGLGNSAAEVDSIMDSAMESVSGTAYGFGEAASMAATFSGAGIKDATELTRILSLVGDTASITGADFNEMGSIWTKVATGQKLQTAEMNQLMDRGLGVLPELQKHYGVTADEARKMVTEGKVSFEDFSEIMENMVGGSAQAMGDTFSGSAANMQAALGRLGAKFLEPVYTNAPAIFQAIGGSVDKLGEHLGPLITAFSEKLNPYIEDFAERLGPWLEQSIDDAAGAVKSMVEWGRQAVDWLKENRDWMETAAVSASVLAGGIALMNFQNKIAVAGGFLKWIQTWTIMTNIQTGAQKALNFAMRMNPIGLLVTGIAALAGGLVWLFSKTDAGQKLWGDFTSALADGWDWVTGKFNYGIELVQTAWKELTEAFSGGDWGYGALAEMIGADQAEWLVNAVASVKEAWVELTAAFTGGDWGYGALSQIIGEDKAEAMVNLIASIGEGFRDFKDDVVDTVTQIWSVAEPVVSWLLDFAGDQLGETLGSLWESFQDVGGAVLEVAGSVGGALWDALMGAYDLFRALWDFLSPVLMPLLKIVAGIVGGVLVGAFMGLIGAVRLAGEVIEFAAGIISWVASNVLSPLIGLVGAVARIFSEVLAGAISALGDYWSNIFGGISKVWDGFTTLLGIGKDFIVATVFGGLGAGLDVVRNSFSTAVEAIGKIWDGLKEIAAAPVRFVVDTVWNNGLLKAVEAIAGFIPGLDAPDPIKLGFARGGILPGFSRMIDGDDQLVPMRRGEGVLVSEGLQDQTSRRLFLAANEEAKQGKSFSQFLEDYVAGYANGGIVGSLNSIMREFYPELQLTSHFRPGDSGYHGKNMAGDFSNTGSGMPSTPAMQAAAAFMFGNYGDQLEQLIHHPARNIGSGMDVGDGFGYYGAGTMYGHTDHIHLAALKPLVDPSGVVQMMPYDGDAGGGFSLMGTVKKLWDAVINKITPFKEDGGWFSKVPGAFLSHAAETMWNFVTGKIGSGSYDGAGGEPGVRESWREMAVAAMRRNGFDADNPAQVEAMLSQIMSESSGIPDRNQEIVDVNGTGAAAGQGLLQIIPGTFAANRDPSLPDDRTDPWANMNAALRYYKGRYGTDLTDMWGHGHGYAHGGIVDIPDLFTRDLGGWVPDGALVRNTSGRDELMLPPELSQAMAGFFADYPEAAEMLAVAADHIESAAEFLSLAADRQSEEGIVARASMRRILDLGLELPGSVTIGAFLDAEESMWASRERHLGHLDSIVEKEEALEKARKALDELQSSEDGLGTKDQRKLDDAQAAVEEAKANVAKADSDEKRAKATEKLADSEERLRRVREDLDENATKNAEKHAEDITKANAEVVQAEQALIEAKKQQVKDLDSIIVLSQESIGGLQSQASGFADQLIGMGAPAGMVSQGLGAVTGALSSVAGMAGPAGISLGMALDLVKTGIELVTTIVDAVVEIIEKVEAARMAALEAVADGWRVIADYAALVAEMQHNVSTLQQEIVRGLNDQRTAEFALRVAQHDRLIAEAAGIVSVAEARLALDKEIERGNIAAQLRLMGLHEDWDSYLSFQALASQGMLDQWSDAAIGALFAYEAARAKALQGELAARLDQINAEAQLAAVTRQNLRNQQDLLKAQERLILMSAEVAGVDLVDATASAQAADLILQMAENRQQRDSNWLGRAGKWLGTAGPWSNEVRGKDAEYAMLKDTLDVLAREYGVNISDGDLNKAIKQMQAVGLTDGDQMAVLRQFFPGLIEAERVLQLDKSLSPIWGAEDQRTDREREEEDFLADIGLFDKTNPLQEAIKGLDYTIAGLEDAASAWADGNEDLRSEYLGSAWANYQAGKDLGANWELDGNYATPGVRDQIVKEVHIHLDGADMYTADQVDQLVQEAMSGTNAKPVVHINASTVAKSKRGVLA